MIIIHMVDCWVVPWIQLTHLTYQTIKVSFPNDSLLFELQFFNTGRGARSYFENEVWDNNWRFGTNVLSAILIVILILTWLIVNDLKKKMLFLSSVKEALFSWFLKNRIKGNKQCTVNKMWRSRCLRVVNAHFFKFYLSGHPYTIFCLYY